MNSVWVDVNGNRFFDETAPSTGRGVPVVSELLKLDGGHAYMIFDSTHKGVAFYDSLAANGLAWQADSLDKLADLAGITPEGLTATIEKYNADYDNGGDTIFGAKKENMVPVVKGPFYAVRVNAVSPAGSDASIYVDDDMTVKLHKDGGRIENLYAAGGVASNSFVLAATGGLGTHVSTALFSGAYAGDCAREAILGK
jgi:hypothetical protein